MEKINYGYVLQKYYPECTWSVMEGKKAYEYDAYLWDITNNILMPPKLELDEKWHLCKRETWMWSSIIEERDKLLQDSDKYVLPDYPHKTEEDRQKWVEYRNQLRDLTRTAVPSVDENNKIVMQYPIKPK
jgi:hypothetical protein